MAQAASIDELSPAQQRRRRRYAEKVAANKPEPETPDQDEGEEAKPAAVEEPVFEVPRALLAVRDFKCPVNGVLMSFEGGDVVKIPQVIISLIRGKAPVIAVDPDQIFVCPHCRKASER